MIERVQVGEVHRRLSQGGDFLLVCAYEEDGSFELSHLKGAISYQSFVARKSALPKNAEIIFY